MRQRISLMGFYFFLFASFGFFAPYIGLHLRQLGWSGTRIGMALFGLTLSGFVGQLLFGALADRLRIKKQLVVALALAGSAMGALTGSATGGLLFCSLLFLGFVHRPLVPLADSAAFDQLAGQGREKYGYFRVFGSFGYLAASGLVSFLVLPKLELNGVFAAFAACLVCASLLAAGLPHQVKSESRYDLQWLRKPPFKWLVAAMFLLEFASTSIQGYLGIYIDRFFEGREEIIPIAWGIGIVSEMALFLACPFLLRKMSARTALLIGGGAAVVRYLFLASEWATGSLALFFLSQLLHGVYYSLFFAAALGFLDSCGSAATRGSVQASASAISTLGGLLVGYLANGWLLDILGLRMLFAVSGMVGAVGLAILFLPQLRELRSPLV